MTKMVINPKAIRIGNTVASEPPSSAPTGWPPYAIILPAVFTRDCK
jgi:hypothetical protein